MKHRIDHTNYEAWLLDRMEGNLSPEQERSLDAFLAANPDLDPGMDELPTLRSDRASLSGVTKDSLKRQLPPIGLPDNSTVVDHIIARLENDLDPRQRKALEAYLFEHPELGRTERLYELTRTTAEVVNYGAKEDLVRDLPPRGLPTVHLMDDLLVARLEGDLDPVQELALNALIVADTDLRRNWERMQRTRIQATLIAYPDKGALKKGGRVIVLTPWVMRLAAAASVALLIGVGIWYLVRPVAPDSAAVAVEQQASGTGTDQKPGPGAATVKVEPALSVVPVHSEEGPVKKHQAPVEVKPPSRDRVPPAPTVVPEPPTVPYQRTNDGPLAQERTFPEQVPEVPADLNKPMASVTPDSRQPQAPAALVPGQASHGPTTLGGALVATLREHVLDEPERDTRPLGPKDAIAMVDRGLRAVSGETAGLDVDRRADGRIGGFKLRLGRNLAISASR